MPTRPCRDAGGPVARILACLLSLVLVAGCTAARPTDRAIDDDLTELQIRMRLLHGELEELRQGVAAQAEQERSASEALGSELDALDARLDALPDELAELCPAPLPAATVTTRIEEPPAVQRVMVRGDKLVVGDLERVWVEPPGVLLTAQMDAAASTSVLHAEEVVEFERDGDKWVRFHLPVAEQPVTVERALAGYGRAPRGIDGNGRRPVVTVRVQLGDVREQVDVVLADLSELDQGMILGRNFLTDMALLEVGRKFVQPAFQASEN
jgi:hypothetical protein